MAEHRQREVNAEDLGAPGGEIPADLTRATTQVDGPARRGDVRGEAVEELAVEGFVGQFVGETVRVVGGNTVVRATDR